jgi:hypothetical protein
LSKRKVDVFDDPRHDDKSLSPKIIVFIFANRFGPAAVRPRQSAPRRKLVVRARVCRHYAAMNLHAAGVTPICSLAASVRGFVLRLAAR